MRSLRRRNQRNYSLLYGVGEILDKFACSFYHFYYFQIWGYFWDLEVEKYSPGLGGVPDGNPLCRCLSNPMFLVRRFLSPLLILHQNVHNLPWRNIVRIGCQQMLIDHIPKQLGRKVADRGSRNNSVLWGETKKVRRRVYCSEVPPW